MENSKDSTELDVYSAALYDAVVTDVPLWLERQLHNLAPQSGIDLDSVTAQTMKFLSSELLGLLLTDVDNQKSNPLHVLRQSTKFLTSALRVEGVPVAVRDEFDVQAMPHDVYSLGPLTWRDISDNVHEAGITWGAWKAATVLTRRRSEGKLDQ